MSGLLPLLALSFLSGLLPAQGLELRERVSAPLLHIGFEAADADGGLGDTWISDLEHLGLDLTGGGVSGGGVAGSRVSDNGPGQSLRLLARGATGLAWEEIEFALTGLLPRQDAADLPLLVFRAKLAAGAAEILRGLLEAGELARPTRSVGAHDVYRLSGGTRFHPGTVIEVALSGVDLIVGNHGMSMDEVLDPRARAGVEVLSANPVYRSLSSKLGVPPGTLVIYADIARLRHRLAAAGLGDADGLLRWSGLASPRGLLLGLHRTEAGTRLSVLIGTGGQREGWLDLVQRMPAQELVQRIPVGGLGGIALALEPSELLADQPARGASARGLRELRQILSDGCSRLGLDLEKQVLPRLGRACAVQFVRGAGGPASARAVVSLQAKNRVAAKRLFDDCARSTRASAAVTMRRGASGSDELVVETGAEHLYLGVVEDALSLAFDDRALARTRESVAASRRERPRVRREIFASLKHLGVSKRQQVAGVFRVDLASLIPGSSPAAGSSPLLRRHVGYLEIEPGVLRLEFLGEN